MLLGVVKAAATAASLQYSQIHPTQRVNTKGGSETHRDKHEWGTAGSGTAKGALDTPKESTESPVVEQKNSGHLNASLTLQAPIDNKDEVISVTGSDGSRETQEWTAVAVL